MAFGNATFSDFGGAASDIFSGIEASTQDNIKAQGDIAEASNYGLAAGLASQNAQFSQLSTAIGQVQTQRQINQTIGTQTAQIGAAGLNESGSALDLLASSAQQGALTKAVGQAQGLITTAGYQEQAQSYQTLQSAATSAAEAEQKAGNQASIFGDISGGIKAAAGLATFFTPK